MKDASCSVGTGASSVLKYSYSFMPANYLGAVQRFQKKKQQSGSQVYDVDFHLLSVTFIQEKIKGISWSGTF